MTFTKKLMKINLDINLILKRAKLLFNSKETQLNNKPLIISELSQKNRGTKVEFFKFISGIQNCIFLIIFCWSL